MVGVNVVHLLTQLALPLRLGPAVEPPATSAMPAQTGGVNKAVVIIRLAYFFDTFEKTQGEKTLKFSAFGRKLKGSYLKN